MAWTEITRPKYRRDGLRYASDTSPCKAPSPGYATSLPMVATPARSCARHSPKCADGPSKSSGDPMLREALSRCRSDGLSNAPLHGSTAIAVSPRTSRLPSRALRLGSSSPASSCSPAGSPGGFSPLAQNESGSETVAPTWHEACRSAALFAAPGAQHDAVARCNGAQWTGGDEATRASLSSLRASA